MSSLEQRGAVFDAETIQVQNRAKEKAFRLFSVPQLIRRVAECDGALFRDHERQNFHLKTSAPDRSDQWVIVFAIDRSPTGIGVVTQMHDHVESYGADHFEYVQDPVRYFADRAPDSVLEGDSR